MQEVEKRQEEGRIRTENILSGNPLLQERMAVAAGVGTGKSDFKVSLQSLLKLDTWSFFLNSKIILYHLWQVRRRWDDDVVFKNCAKGQLDNRDVRFINDSLRSDFHRKFMEKYIK